MDSPERSLLANLQLPRMPTIEREDDDGNTNSIPTIRILAVADVDLPSVAALSEHALQSEYTDEEGSTVIGGGAVDLIIAIGPFVRDEDLLPYLTNRVARRKFEQTGWRTPELAAATDGILTACLSQLETIVCRLVYIHSSVSSVMHLSDGSSDPMRLTPNSRNVDQQWLGLCPGLGVAGLREPHHPEENDDVATIRQLVHLAPSTSIPPMNPQEEEIPFGYPYCQSILISQLLHPDQKEEPFMYQVTDVDSDSITEDYHVPLHVRGSVSDASHEVVETTHVVNPGSLRRNGEFCLIDMGIRRVTSLPRNDNKAKESNTEEESESRILQYEWYVDNVKFEKVTYDHR